MSEWQPIETAPKYPLDEFGRGPRILAFGKAIPGFPRFAWNPENPRINASCVICWVEHEFEVDEPAGEIDGQIVYKKVKRKSCEHWGPEPQQFWPTHWMPLPPPPSD